MALAGKKAVIYARVSTERQEKEKTIKSQIEELREVCRKDNVRVVNEYIDNGFSGSTLARPALDQLRNDASRGLFEVVYIHSSDRLARKLVYQLLVIEELKQKGIEVVFLNKPITDNPEDQLLLGIQRVITEYERAKIVERTRRSMLHRTRNGKIMRGSPPYGYDYMRKSGGKSAHFKVNEEKARSVWLIFSLYLQHRTHLRLLRS
ncbi:MAG: recombinase family protein [Thermoproteota archaeon]|jgi:site-specific DNA recombinase